MKVKNSARMSSEKSSQYNNNYMKSIYSIPNVAIYISIYKICKKIKRKYVIFILL